MSLSAQAANPTSTLCTFLDAQLPQRDAIVEQWKDQLHAAPQAAFDVDAGRRWLGTALEIRLGLDLAGKPAYWELLSFLPAEQCYALLTAAGFAPPDYDHMPASGTTDPLLLDWNRVTCPTQCEDPTQRAALAACIDAANFDQLAHRLHAAPAAQVRRSFLLTFREAGAVQADENHPVFRGLHHMWRGYLRHARNELNQLGERTIISPPVAVGFAAADLSIGRTLVEVKASADPTEYLHIWLNQLLGYLLLDRFDIFCWDTIAIYLGWHAAIMAVPVEKLLTAATSSLTPALDHLRTEFHQLISKELDEAAMWYLQDRHPIPPQTSTPSRPGG
ncbi:hypothetical protein [Actinoallomurus iriomotensis]|uniref:Uncharacterized protein n=1 Tax=Actinoallomurus iriomotensis TaxID=478107 RepID=A0A9W6RQF5_9ACTN|nr:hypothetical protein [Actinoallomurus iriomotensis]GLY80591.1 hypothetical protein Airi01_088580 [Actinoallomurus iriomotensis]